MLNDIKFHQFLIYVSYIYNYKYINEKIVYIRNKIYNLKNLIYITKCIEKKEINLRLILFKLNKILLNTN